MRSDEKVGGAATWLVRHRPQVIVGLVAALALCIDLVTKWWALQSLAQDQVHPLLGDFLGLQLVFNPGAAFSMGEGVTWVFTLLTVAVIAGLVWFSSRLTHVVPAVITGLLLGGALGNLWDRLTQPPGFGRGHVVYFIRYGYWFVGNVADIWIVVAAVALVAWVLTRPESSDKGENKGAPRE